MEITAVEVGQFLKFRFVEHRHVPAMQVDNAVFAQLPDHPIGVHCGDSKCVGDLLLGERRMEIRHQSGEHPVEVMVRP